MANKIRAVKASKEAANKQTTTAAHTLKVMQEIDQAAQKEAKLIGNYHTKEKSEKKKASGVASEGEAKLQKEQKALKRVEDSVVKNDNR